jgi:nitrosocyanin
MSEPQKPNSKFFVIILVLLTGIVVMLGYKSYKNRAVPKQADNVTVQPAKQDAPKNIKPAEASVNVTVTGANYSFEPKEIKVKKDDVVKITFKNIEGFHDLRIDEYAVKTQVIKANEVETVQFTADKTGTFEYYCSVGQHRANGMFGKLIVE